MKSKLCIYVCQAFLPEVKQIIDGGSYLDVDIKGFPMDCMGKYLTKSYIDNLTGNQLKYYSKVIFIGSSCVAGRKEDLDLEKKNLEIILVDQCYEILLNPSMVEHFIRERYYIVSNNWLNDYEKHIEEWGFDPDSAKDFFAESTTKILFIDTGLPGNHAENLKKLSAYMGLPYEILPVGLGYCKLFIDSIIYKWREEKEKAGLNEKLAQASSRTADYSLVFNMLLNIGEINDEKEIVEKIFNILNVFFAPHNIKYYPIINDEPCELIIFNKEREKAIEGFEKSFCVEFYDKNLVAGKFEIIGVKFPEHIGKYKELSQIIAQISGLAIANARKFKIIQNDKGKILLQLEELEKLNMELIQSRGVIEKNLFERNALIDELTVTKEKLEIINSEKDKFFSIIAHDLRSPFQGLVGLTKIMAEDVDSFTISEIASYSEEMNKTANAVFMLIQNLLQWAEMQRGTVSFNTGKLELLQLVTQSITAIEKNIITKQIILSIDVPALTYINADEMMVGSILRNLVTNAVKFTAKGGRVNIRSKEIENQMVEISIQDSGIGMSEELCSRLFKLGENIGRRGTDGEESTGLGLLLCKDFVEKHGGAIWVESKLGGGSTFHFTIPQYL